MPDCKLKKLIKAVIIVVVVLALAAAAYAFKAGSNEVICRDESIKIATERANLKPEDIFKCEAELDRELFSLYYEVELEDASTEYDFKIDANTGKVISFRSEPRD